MADGFCGSRRDLLPDRELGQETGPESGACVITMYPGDVENLVIECCPLHGEDVELYSTILSNLTD